MAPFVLEEKLEALEKKLRYVFRDRGLLSQALTHRSTNANNYERLEFLGDYVLGFVVSEYLYKRYPLIQEGKLTRMRSELVCGRCLAQVSQTFRLVDYIVFSAATNQVVDDIPISVQEDVVESIIGAVYLDSGWAEAQQLILYMLSSFLEDLNPDDSFKNSKTLLQELLQSQNEDLPTYVLEKIEGKEHEKIFYVSCCLVNSNKKRSMASDTSIRRAEQRAAQSMLIQLSDNH